MSIPLPLIISGGQTGVDVASWRAARRAGLPTGGWMPRGFLTELGPRPEFAELYGAREHASDKYPPRTYMNVKCADATFWMGGGGDSPGYACTKKACQKYNRPFLKPSRTCSPKAIADYMRAIPVFNPAEPVFNFAGSRRSRIGIEVEKEIENLLTEAFTIYKGG